MTRIHMRCIRCLFDAYRSSSGASEIRRHPREGGGGAETLAASPAVSPTLGGWCGAALVAGHRPSAIGHLPHVHLAMASMTALLTRLVTHLLAGIHHDCRTTFATPLATARVARRTTVSRAVVCSVDKTEQLGKAAAAVVLSAVVGLTAVDAAQADVAGLTPCSQSKAFAKRKKQEVKALNKRLKNYEEGSAPALALKATIEKTEKRFDKYGKQGLLCGTDGLPHLIADPGLALRYGHAGDVLLPTIGFIYVAGWIGYSGTKYVQAAKTAAKPTEKEIIIDVPMAWGLLWAGLGWPMAAWTEFRNGELLEDDSKITVSPR
jgi:photosystem I subunit 3